MSSPSTIDTVLRRTESGEYFSRLVNRPAPHRLRARTQLVYHAALHALEPRFTVVMPAFDHESGIQDSLEAAAINASLPFDCIVVDDGSGDRTVERAQWFFESRRASLLARATVVRNPVPVYETASDNLGFALAETEIIIELQADIQIREPGFDALFMRALATSPKPSAISGRCGQTFRSLCSRRGLPSLFRRQSHEMVGLCGKAIETPEVVNPIKGRIYRCETVNRGPWVLLKSDLERHGYLDECHFFLRNDDHDYHRRVFEAEGRRPLYVPMSLYAPLALGAERRRRTGVNRDVFNTLKAEKRGSPAFHHFLDSLGPSSPPVAIPAT
jgi:glycosyltransferase involved in cell wall biosynthesis